MHEASIAQSLIELAEKVCREQGHSKINSLKVNIGALSGVMPDALQFAFDAMKEDSTLKDAVLEISTVSASGICNSCKDGFTVETQYIIECPLCKGSDFVITHGREMELTEMEVD